MLYNGEKPIKFFKGIVRTATYRLVFFRESKTHGRVRTCVLLGKQVFKDGPFSFLFDAKYGYDEKGPSNGYLVLFTWVIPEVFITKVRYSAVPSAVPPRRIKKITSAMNKRTLVFDLSMLIFLSCFPPPPHLMCFCVCDYEYSGEYIWGVG
jgi:hypothetical protein